MHVPGIFCTGVKNNRSDTSSSAVGFLLSIVYTAFLHFKHNAIFYSSSRSSRSWPTVVGCLYGSNLRSVCWITQTVRLQPGNMSFNTFISVSPQYVRVWRSLWRLSGLRIRLAFGCELGNLTQRSPSRSNKYIYMMWLINVIIDVFQPLSPSTMAPEMRCLFTHACSSVCVLYIATVARTTTCVVVPLTWKHYFTRFRVVRECRGNVIELTSRLSFSLAELWCLLRHVPKQLIGDRRLKCRYIPCDKHWFIRRQTFGEFFSRDFRLSLAISESKSFSRPSFVGQDLMESFHLRPRKWEISKTTQN